MRKSTQALLTSSESVRRSNRWPLAGTGPRGAAGKRRSQTLRNRQLEAAAWKQQHGKPVDPTEFEREILPLLQGVPLKRLMQATGLSLGYVSQIRRGERTAPALLGQAPKRGAALSQESPAQRSSLHPYRDLLR